MLALTAALALLLVGLDARSGGKKWDEVWSSPMVIDYDESDMGGVSVECEAIKVPGCCKGELELDCDLTYQCDIRYVAQRVLTYPGGYENKGDVVVEKTVSLSPKAHKKLGNRIFIRAKGERFLVELFENKKKTLEIEGWDVCGSGSEAGVGTTFIGVARTPGAPTFHYGAVSLAGSDPAKGKTTDVLKTAVACYVRQEFLE
jgi:hypothetical protein